MTNKNSLEALGLERQKIVEDIMSKKAEIIDLFVKTFMVTEVKDYERFKTGMLELVCGNEMIGTSMHSTYKCVFIPLDEYEDLKKKVVKQKELEKAHQAGYERAVEEMKVCEVSMTPEQVAEFLEKHGHPLPGLVTPVETATSNLIQSK